MERREDGENESCSSQQNTMWKQFQARAKPLFSAKLGTGDPEDKKQRCGTLFRKKDRMISSSQPDLFPSQVGAREAQVCGKAPGSSGSGWEKLSRQQSASSSKPTVAQLLQSHHKSSSLGSACAEKLAESLSGGGGEAATAAAAAAAPQLENGDQQPVSGDQQPVNGDQQPVSGDQQPVSGDQQPGMGAPSSSAVTPEKSIQSSGMYKLEIELKRGNNLAIRDRGGTSDPYVRFKLGGKDVFKSKTISKNLNPVWDEKTTLTVDSLNEPLHVKVFDHDFWVQDDFMGSADLYLDSLEQHRTIPVTLELKDIQHPDEDLGTVELDVTLTPKESPIEERRDASQQQQSVRRAEQHRKSEHWRGIVSIGLIEGRKLCPMDQNGLSDPFVKFKLGQQKYKSKAVSKTLNPQWREQFDLHQHDESGGILEVSVWDKDIGRKDEFMGRCQVDLSTLAKDRTHHLDLPLEDSQGFVVLQVRLTALPRVSIADLCATPLNNPQEREDILQRYRVSKSLNNLKDVGIVQVKVLKAGGLMSADVTGKSDPFCVLELTNDRLQTHTVYKNLNPEWNKVFTFNVKDIHALLEVTVFDEDRDGTADFLGKVAIPLLAVRNGVQKCYALKNKDLTGPTKGVIYLEIDVIYNVFKAAFRTINPAEQKYIEDEAKVSKQLLQQNLNRVKRCIMVLITCGSYVNSCFQWESSVRSMVAFVLFVVVVWNFELYMLPLALLLLLVWNYLFSSYSSDTSTDAVFDWEDEEDEDETMSFMDKLHAIQDVIVTVQGALDEVASYGERLKNTVNWTVPFLSLLAITALSLATALLYLVPLRLIVLAWGVNKFTKKLRNPFLISNNELLDFLSRVPSDVQVIQYRQLRADPGLSPNKRKKTSPS
ncbi:Multiple C2 and transmembrane domain-containing protein 1 [Collichthys lucidus]|uniref:Multiple C2 and transmembrane domain-containing protein 1 n=1 Tax=Collichthys lucidus TaxID=240159 RepID=A0A4U5VB73_COLLU|nr:Multiple C2 and transmembrane domain-containing protein 1 [Collichthys lucidus]